MELAGILPQFGNFAFTIGAFVLALLIIVAIHEYGHYIVGKWTGIHAEVFSLGFGPVLWSRHDKHGTRWQIAALPFGGYVKFLGDKDAASGKDEDAAGTMTPEELRHTMHGAPLWARAATVVAGPVFNFILSVVIFTGMALAVGVASYPPVVDKVLSLPAQVAGLESGDRLVAIEGVKYPEPAGYAEFSAAIPMKPVLDYTIERDGREMVVKGPQLTPPLVGFVSPGSAAEAAGIQVGDVVLSIGDTEVFEFGQMVPLVNATGGAPTRVTVWRNGDIVEFTIEPRRKDLPRADNTFETRYVIGISGSYFFTPGTETVGVFKAVQIATDRTIGIASLSLSGLSHMIAGKISSCNMSGPIGIAKASGQMASKGLKDFILFVALLSTAVGLLNLFPIPVLDGGHLVFFAYEAVAGKPPNGKILNILMLAGLSLLLSMMVFATLNDILC
jgi:regulator of sigma E protease